VAVRAQGTATVDQVKMNIAKDVTELIGAWADACVCGVGTVFCTQRARARKRSVFLRALGVMHDLMRPPREAGVWMQAHRMWMCVERSLCNVPD
jgi:hypothetical protein